MTGKLGALQLPCRTGTNNGDMAEHGLLHFPAKKEFPEMGAEGSNPSITTIN